MEYTLSIIKPDGVRRNLQNKILNKFTENGLTIVAQKMVHLSKANAQKFYAIHSARPFFDDLCTYMSSAPVSIQILKGENAVEKHRNVMGATNPADAADNTIRKEFGISIDENTVHGSDSVENAKLEISQFFNMFEIFDAEYNF